LGIREINHDKTAEKAAGNAARSELAEQATSRPLNVLTALV
jgi:hypothetical protein